MTEPRDPYVVLQVDPRAEPAVIRAAYLRLAKKYHPDAGSGDHERMVALNEAWALLRDPARRAAYDESRRPTPVPPANPAPGHSTVPHAPRRRGAAAAFSGTTLDFGRYAGWTLHELAREDPDYLVWLARAPGGRQYRSEIQAILSTRPPVTQRAADWTRPRPTCRWHLPWRGGDLCLALRKVRVH